MSYTPWFPEPGSYIRYFDFDSQEVKYRRLTWRRDPLTYPRRLAAVAAGSKSAASIGFDELNPSEDKKHLYLAYLGVKPGFLYYLYHPVDIKNLKWDENIEDIDKDLVACITYESSPYEYPVKTIGIDHDRYPAIEAKNICGETKHPEVIWIASLYKVIEQKVMTQDELTRLRAGTIRSHPWDFGGEL